MAETKEEFQARVVRLLVKHGRRGVSFEWSRDGLATVAFVGKDGYGCGYRFGWPVTGAAVDQMMTMALGFPVTVNGDEVRSVPAVPAARAGKTLESLRELVRFHVGSPGGRREAGGRS
jgi:hypothetical protein